jgi:alpha-1,2-mannosyltransferase
VPNKPRGFLVAVTDRPVTTQSWLRIAARRASGRPQQLLLLFTIPVLLVCYGIVAAVLGLQLGVDSTVYRSGALTLLHGESLYDLTTLHYEPYWALLPFTYPPTAALLFVPLALVPGQVAWGILGGLSVLAMTLVIRVSVAQVKRMPAWMSPARVTLILAVLLLALEPVWRTVSLGQINLILMAMVVLDVLVVCTDSGGRWRKFGGVLTGIAAAVKLTPLIFVPHLFITGKKADGFRALGTFVVLQLLMLAAAPHDALMFWGKAVSDPGRTGPVYIAGNQSLNGLIARLSSLAPWTLQLAIAIGLLLAIPVFLLVRRFHRQRRPLPALLVTAFYGLLVSPVSWSHHWVWVVPLVVFMLSRLPDHLPDGTGRIVRFAGLIGVIAVFCSCVLIVIVPTGAGIEMYWNGWDFLLGSAYLLVPVVAGLWFGVRWLRRRIARRRTEGSVESTA